VSWISDISNRIGARSEAALIFPGLFIFLRCERAKRISNPSAKRNISGMDEYEPLHISFSWTSHLPGALHMDFVCFPNFAAAS
jgi:hypothetical protein